MARSRWQFLSGFKDHIVKLRPIVGLQRAKKSAVNRREVTVYIKGFLGKQNNPLDFEPWLDSHAHTHWNGDVLGWRWGSGTMFEIQQNVPVPFLTMAGILSRRVPLTPQGLALASIAEGLVFSGRLYLEYRSAILNAGHEAEILARFLLAIRENYDVVRVVAHSLGCSLLINALGMDGQESSCSSSSSSSSGGGGNYNLQRMEFLPDHVHLCGAAMSEEKAAPVLERGIATNTATIYYTRRDTILNTAFRAIEQESAMGWQGVTNSYPGIIQKDVSEFFDLKVHNEYQNKFHLLYEENETVRKM